MEGLFHQPLEGNQIRQEFKPGQGQQEEPAESSEWFYSRTGLRLPPIVGGLVLQLVISALQIGNLALWAWMHGITALNNPAQVAGINFIGVDQSHLEPSVWSVFLALAPQCIAGVLARSQYQLAQVILQGERFNFLEGVSRLIGDVSLGSAVAVCAVYFLRISEITVAQVSLTLRTASLETIVALGFILGFFHEDTRRLLGNCLKKVLGTSETD
ncbi:MAG: hypothetical protein L0332_25250 [Chloroflexi bacterium]|nr:hypothetical protein [Chloroflexota bacterium]MCI0575198.1 hypothetical protein [Chloroflexota bacterium]MCI0647120.1 hypothetical protein [Chloroflexota bacterium]MCI0730004.1 hypothetical protein [Chloroflexota bacterium]